VSGHSPGGAAYYCPAADVVFTGDALFAGSIGRTDFPGSSMDRLLANIREHLFALPEETAVYSGHGPPTTIGEERETNPWIQEDDDE
jgi:glyoxylase-like metal-dependent hydrolase (beta-lactamase superfamily II)